MSKDRKIRVGWFLAWNYDNEEQYLNRYSEKGWRLSEVYLFHKVFVRDDKRYRYRIDFNQTSKLSKEERERYIETFSDMGWKYVGGIFNGWNYFEKQVVEGSEEEDYSIYTDDSSLKDTLQRWIHIARLLEIMCLFISLYNFSFYLDGHRAHLLLALTTMIEFVLFEFGIISMKRKRIGTQKSHPFNVFIGNILFISIYVCLIVAIVGVYNIYWKHKLIDTKFSGTLIQENREDNLSFLVDDDGWYHMKANCEAESGSVTLAIYDNNKEIYRVSGTDFTVNKKLRLEEGIHRAKVVIHNSQGEKEDGVFYSYSIEIE